MFSYLGVAIIGIAIENATIGFKGMSITSYIDLYRRSAAPSNAVNHSDCRGKPKIITVSPLGLVDDFVYHIDGMYQ